jgi:hypothetical protein
MIGLALMVISPFVLAIVHGEGDEYDALKAQGMVTMRRLPGMLRARKVTPIARADPRRGPTTI